MKSISLSIIAIGCALVAAMSACGGGSGGNSGTTAGPTSQVSTPQFFSAYVKSDKAYDQQPIASDAEVAAVANGNNTFALAALAQSAPDENSIFSPYSVTNAAALLAAGAKGDTLTRIEQALSFPLPQARFKPSLSRLNLLLKSASSTLEGAPQLNIANSLWAQQGFQLSPNYLDDVSIHYDTGMHVVDFVSQTEFARGEINQWVAQATHDKIKNLLPDGSLDPQTRLTLVNAIWFKGDWQAPFAKDSSVPRDFIGRDGSTKSVTFMQQENQFAYLQGGNFVAIEMPYVGNQLAMLIVMPTSGSIDHFIQHWQVADLNSTVQTLQMQDLILQVPKFSITNQIELQALLTQRGMGEAFDSTRADFSGIDGARDLHVTRALQSAFIAVDEKGTEAAAATGIVTGITSVRTPPPTLVRFDHPFLYVLRDKRSGAVLFVGKVVQMD